MKKQVIVSDKMKENLQHLKLLRRVNTIRKPLFDRRKGPAGKDVSK